MKSRRQALTIFTAGIAAMVAVGRAPRVIAATGGRVVIVGGGFGGVTAARTLKQLNPYLEILLIEPNRQYVSCPMSNLVLSGEMGMGQLTFDYQKLSGRFGIEILPVAAARLDAQQRQVILADKQRVSYDKLIVSPGIDFVWGGIEGYVQETAEIFPHAWKAGPQTLLLKQQLDKMPDGGTVAISVPSTPFRCPPGPYERASQIAQLIKNEKPHSKLLILDGQDQFSKQALFEKAWNALYPGVIEWVPKAKDGEILRVDAKNKVLYGDFESWSVDVANVIPPQRAGAFARDNGLTDATGWCPVNAADFSSSLLPDIHVIGDAALANPLPKSAFAAASQAKLVAHMVVAELKGLPRPKPALANVCYSLVGPEYGISIAGIYRVDGGKWVGVKDAGGVSPLEAESGLRATEARHAESWFQSMIAESFGT